MNIMRMAEAEICNVAKLCSINPKWFAAISNGNILIGGKEDVELRQVRVTTDCGKSINRGLEIKNRYVVDLNDIGANVLVSDVADPRCRCVGGDIGDVCAMALVTFVKYETK